MRGKWSTLISAQSLWTPCHVCVLFSQTSLRERQQGSCPRSSFSSKLFESRCLSEGAQLCFPGRAFYGYVLIKVGEVYVYIQWSVMAEVWDFQWCHTDQSCCQGPHMPRLWALQKDEGLQRVITASTTVPLRSQLFKTFKNRVAPEPTLNQPI